MKVLYRCLRKAECERIREIDASQYIDLAWRMTDGERALVPIRYMDADYPEGFAAHLARVRGTMEGGGAVIGAFDAERLVGFAAVNRALFGVQYRYALLDQLFVTRPLRGMGIGGSLFLRAAGRAARWGAEKLYICAGSAEKTVAFYRAMGCVDALEVDSTLAASDPRDLQLEYTMRA